MHVVANRVPVAADWQQAFEERFRNRAGQIDQQPGFVRMAILKPVSEGAPYVVETVWENAAAFQAWIGSDDFKAAHANPLPKEAFAGESTMEQHELIVSA